MKLPSAGTVWIVIVVAAAIISVGLLARAKARDGIIYGLKSYVMEQGQDERRALEQFANDVLAGELGKSAPDEMIVASAFNILKQTADAEAVNRQVEEAGKNLLDRACAAAQPDEDLLKLGDQFLALVSSPARTTYLERIAAWSREREGDAGKLSDLSKDLVRQGSDPAGDGILAEVRDARADLIEVANPWILGQNPVIAAALAGSEQAVLLHFNAILQQQQSPETAQRLRAAWDILRDMRLDRNIDASARAKYADAVRVGHLSPEGLIIGLCVLVALGASMTFAVIRVIRGPTPIDPGAETLENVEPIDFDTDAETLEAAKRPTRAGDSHDTTVH
jgi:hypothetical protein